MQAICVLVIVLVLVCGSAMADWSVTDAGAVGDGVFDNTVAFQKALDDAATAGGGVVNVPAGRFAVKGNLAIPAGVTLQGTYRSWPLAFTAEYQKLPGTVLLAYAGRGSNEGKPFIKLAGSSATVMGLIVVYPEAKKADVPPVAYPPCIESDDTENVAIIDCAVLNPYEAIKLIRAHRHIVRDFQGYPSWRGIYVDQCYDIGHIENVHIWPFGTSYEPNDEYSKWINLNATAFEFARTDWEYVFNTFCFGYGVGYKFSETKSGSTNGNFLGIGADCCERAVKVDQCQGPGLLITNGEFVGRWGSSDAVCMEIGENVSGKVSLVNCSFWGPIDRCVWMRAPKGQFTASATHFLHWDCRKVGNPAILLDAGKAIIQGNTFGDGSLHVQVGEKVISAIVMGNQAQDGLVVENKAGSRTQMIGNELETVILTDRQKAHYTLRIGAEGDARRIRGWYDRETAAMWGAKGTMRWSMVSSQLMLPVVPGKAYSVEVGVYIPEYAIDPKAGVYLGAKRIIAFTKPGTMVLKGEIPASKQGVVTLDVKCSGWVPSKVVPLSNDGRTLGVAVHSVTLRAKGAPDQVFDANTGKAASGK